VAGRLLVVGTPIGNLGDLTPRAAEALRSADLVVAEDTRLARRLLAHLAAKRPTVSFNDHSPDVRLGELLARLGGGATLALTTDAGMPGVSDPGARLVAAARAAGATVEVVPGPSAVTAAIAVSGVESLGFVFGGFLPARPAAARSLALRRLLDASGAMLGALDEIVPRARVAACRELTKLHEEIQVGRPAELRTRLTAPRGEMTLVISAIPAAEAAASLDVAAVVETANRAGLAPRTIVELLRASGVPRREAYRAATGPADRDQVSDR